MSGIGKFYHPNELPNCSSCGTNSDYQTKCCRDNAHLRARVEKLEKALDKLRMVVYHNAPKGHPCSAACFACGIDKALAETQAIDP